VKLTEAAMDRLMHRQRAEIDAIAVGAGTLLADDPLLTPRGAFRPRPLVRVVFDWRLRCAAERRLYRTLETGPVWLLTTDRSAAEHRADVASLAERGVRVITLPCRDLARALQVLGQMEVTSLLVEGGPTLQDALADARLVDRVQTIVVSRTLGSGVPSPKLLGIEDALGEPVVTRAGPDTLLEADVHGTD
jgi:diaminohydroxyphosphoribosylaminopyrimidine deaminase/5-amino-6-(5-phosphoribosylamino)uracil reductase